MNATEVSPVGTVTDAGTLNTALVFVSATTAPPAGATLVRVTVQVLVPFAPRLLGLHASDETSTGAVKLIVALDELLL